MRSARWHRSGPTTAVAIECARALGSLAVAPAHAVRYALGRADLRAELLRYLSDPEPMGEPPRPLLPAGRPLEVFVSCAEPSGETHAAGLVRCLREEAAQADRPSPRIAGLGGERLVQAGVETIANPVERAAMGTDVLASIPYYLSLLSAAARSLRERRPDLCVLVDSPALHVPLGHLARRFSIPVAHLATPQYWAWAPWRVRSYRKAVDLALTILPFEPAWFRARGVRVAHVGHPLLDEIGAEEPRRGEASNILVLLPGSRASVVHRNLPWMIAAAGRLRLSLPEVEIVIPHQRGDLAGAIEEHVRAARAESWIRVEAGRLHENLRRSRAALSVSGTILIDLLVHRVPTVVVYRLNRRLSARLSSQVLSVPWFSSVNLLAGREIYPEFCFSGEGPIEEVGKALERCYNDSGWRQECARGMEEASRRLGPRGATLRAARHALALAASSAKGA